MGCVLIIAYMLLVHTNPEQVERVVSALPASSSIFIHVDKRAEPGVYEDVVRRMQRREKVCFVPRFASRWASAGITRATFSLINAAVAQGVAFDYATLLSGSDYPIKSNAAIAEFLTQRQGSEFIESFAMEKPNRWSDLGGLYRAPDKALRYHFRIRSRVLKTPITRRLPYGLTAYGGSQWWTLSRPAVAYISEFLRQRPKFDRFLNGVFIPDEFAVQTILGNSPFADRLVSDDLRFAIWDRPVPPYPATLKSGDVAEMLASDKLFARKFSMSADSAVFDRIDEAIGSASVTA